MKLTRTVYHVIAADGVVTAGAVEWPEIPGYHEIKALITPLIGGDPLEHVSVLHWGRRCDMFVSEIGRLQLLPINRAATEIYRHNWVHKHPECDPETLDEIAGVAVLFERIVWT